MDSIDPILPLTSANPPIAAPRIERVSRDLRKDPRQPRTDARKDRPRPSSRVLDSSDEPDEDDDGPRHIDVLA